MYRTIILFLFMVTTSAVAAQEPKHGTIHLRKTGQLSKIHFDDVYYRLIGIDAYGNVLDSAVLEFTMSVTIKGVFYSESAAGPSLTYDMQRLLGNSDRTSVVYFDKIKARDRSGNIVEMPKFRYNFGYVDEDND